eukprot:472877-Pleurochrysis_carterae.AAC.1
MQAAAPGKERAPLWARVRTARRMCACQLRKWPCLPTAILTLSCLLKCKRRLSARDGACIDAK